MPLVIIGSRRWPFVATDGDLNAGISLAMIYWRGRGEGREDTMLQNVDERDCWTVKLPLT